MQDEIILGTGNSRYLKSAVPSGTTWEQALSMLQEGTFPIDLNGKNAAGIAQQGTPLSKATLLSDATAASIFGDSYVGALADAPVGTIVNLMHNGQPVPHIVVHQGNPDSTLYDASCDGTWLLMKGIYENRAWNSSNVNSYKDSIIYNYLNSTFFDLFDSSIKSAVKQVKIPYVNGTGSSPVASGSNGLSAKVFLLSGYEVGFTTSVHQYFPIDGAKLGYFVSGNDSTAQAKRVAKLNGSAFYWWLRSPSTYDTTTAWRVNSGGNYDGSLCMSAVGVRPAVIVDPTGLFVKADGTLATTDSDLIVPDDAFNKIANLLNGVSDVAESKLSYTTGSYTGVYTKTPDYYGISINTGLKTCLGMILRQDNAGQSAMMVQCVNFGSSSNAPSFSGGTVTIKTNQSDIQPNRSPDKYSWLAFGIK